jgi:hypothetical protein
MNNLNDKPLDAQIAVLIERTENIEKKVDAIGEQMNSSYVTKDKFDAICARLSFVERILFGTVGVIGTSVLVALLKLVVFP